MEIRRTLEVNGAARGGPPASPWRTIWTRPRATIRTIVGFDPRHRALAIAAGVGLARALLRASARDLGDHMPQIGVLGACLVLGPALGILGLYAGAAILRVVARWLGGRASAAETRAALAWGSVPYLAILALWAVALLIGGEDVFTSAGPAHPGARIALAAIYGVDLVLLGWSLVLTVACLVEVLRLSARRVVAACLATAPLALAIALVPVALLAVLDGARKARFQAPPAAIVAPAPIRPAEPEEEVAVPARSARPPAEAGPAVAAFWDEHCRVEYRADPKRPGRPIVRLVLSSESGERFNCQALRHLDEFPDLEELEISAMDLADADLAPLRGLKRLLSLTILFGKITDTGLESLDGLTELEEVRIIGCERIRGPGLVHLEGAKRLRSLSLSGCRVGGADLAHVRRLSSLKELDIGNMDRGVLDDASLVHLDGWAGLETLYLGFTNPIRGPGLVHLEGLRDLRALDLTNSPVTDDGVDPLAAMTWLRDLDLSGTSITRAGLGRLRRALPKTKIDPPERGW